MKKEMRDEMQESDPEKKWQPPFLMFITSCIPTQFMKLIR